MKQAVKASKALGTSAVVLFFRLPFALPMTPGEKYVFHGYEFADGVPTHESNPPVVKLSLHQIPVDPPPYPRPGFYKGLSNLVNVEFDLCGGVALTGQFHDTWVEVIMPKAAFADDRDREPPTSWIERALAVVNKLIVAYRLVAHDPLPFEVTVRNLDPVLLFQHLDTITGERTTQGLTLLNVDGPVPRRPVGARIEGEIRTVVGLQLLRHPFTLQGMWLERAKHIYYNSGDLSGGVIYLQTAAETLLWALYRMTLVDEGRTRSEIDDAVKRVRFARLVGEVLPEQLAAGWDVNDRNQPMGAYWHHLYKLRCKIVHEGYSPTIEDAALAFDSWDNLMNFLLPAVATARCRIPRTALGLLGVPGLKRLGYFDDDFEGVANAIGAEPTPFWLPHDVAGRPGG